MEDSRSRTPGFALGQGAGKTQPLLAVVVAVAEKILAEKNLEAGAQGAGEKYHEEQQQGAEQKRYLQHRSPGAAEVADVVAGTRHPQEVCRGTEQRR